MSSNTDSIHESAERAPNEAPAFFVHPKGLVDSADVGEGTRVWAFAHVLKGAKVGAHCNIGECSFVENGAVLGDHVTIKNGVQVWWGVTCEDYVFVGPNATFTNDHIPRSGGPKPEGEPSWERTHVGHGASIGANATIIAPVKLGSYCLVGAGSVVTRDVPPHALVMGNPAQAAGWVCNCGTRLASDLSCPSCHKRFVRIGAPEEGLAEIPS